CAPAPVRAGAGSGGDAAAAGHRRPAGHDPREGAAMNEMRNARTAVSSEPLLSVQSVAHSFGGLHVLRDVSIGAAAGRVVGLIGPNGSGKTTLFNIITGFLQPKAGTVLLDGRDVTRAGLLRTFQTPKVFEHMSVLENVMMGSHAATHGGFLATMFALPGPRAELAAVRRQAMETCEKFGISSIMAARSGGLP